MNDDVLWIVTEELQTSAPEGQRGWQGNNPFSEPRLNGTPQTKHTPVPLLTLAQNMTHLLQQVEHMFKDTKQSITGLTSIELNEVELEIEINAEGQISLLGSGSKVGGKGTMTLKFKAK
jgi:hypothetical protein